MTKWISKDGSSDYEQDTNPFEDKWGEQWVYVPSKNWFRRTSDRFTIDDLKNYTHRHHSCYQVKMDTWIYYKRQEVRGWDYLD